MATSASSRLRSRSYQSFSARVPRNAPSPIDTAPANISASPAISTSRRDASDADTPATNASTVTSPSLVPNTKLRRTAPRDAS